MLGLITMLLTTLGATGMGSMLKMVAGVVDRIAAGSEAKEKRELLREMNLRGADIDFQKAVFGELNENTTKYVRTTRRIIALVGMLNFFVISVLCTIWPSVPIITFIPPLNKDGWSILWGLINIPATTDITVAITTGHISLVCVATLGAIIGFYFTPAGRK